MESGGGGGFGEHRSTMSLDQGSGVHSRMPADAGYNGIHPPPAVNGDRALARRPAILRPSSGSISFTRNHITNTQRTQHIQHPLQPIIIKLDFTYADHISPVSEAYIAHVYLFRVYTLWILVLLLESLLCLFKRSDFVDQSQEALSLSSSSLHMQGYNAHARVPMGPIDYPDLSLSMGMGAMSLSGGVGHGSGGMVRPPPPVAAPATLDHGRQDSRRALASPPATAGLPSSSSSSTANLSSGAGAGVTVGGLTGVGGPTGVGGLTGLNGPVPPRIASDYPVVYWPDVNIGVSGLKNLGNTCYMNAPIQCLSATVPFSRFFTEGRWRNAVNYTNPLGSKGKLASAFAKLLHEMWGGDLPYLTPIDFRKSICQLNTQYNGSDQHDSQEFLSFLIDGIHEDLNRIIAKPPKYTPTPEEDAELERLPPQIASEREWRAWRARNDSLIVDFFQGQFRNRLECLTCHKTSTTYNVFSILSLPVPNMRSGKVPIERCIDAFFNEEVLEKDDAWDCPQCKTKRRASKKLSLARLPPILVIHLKRFEANGRFSDKIDTFVDFPMKSLDLTNYMPPPLPPGADRSQLNGGLPMSLEDPRTQVPPYRYDLYGVTNHYGNLSSGHYTAFIASRGGWMYCDDSSVKPVDAKQVVSQKAYVLFYKRVRP
ncbi:hypothetical protein CVT26_003040 [Gymnopilus dilepis]|uniref:Ubiquitin carboxyl-terminal hydrolase n=1 Tax=Gymnopilus dilepis TaxID=231916 RepID=A0A409Y4X4_9AGAR|nr:hypothetical protein CVT26_003040 [Gymnopilus dilepis]